MVEEDSLVIFYVCFFMQATSPQFLNAFKWGIGELNGLFNISHLQFILLTSPKWENLCVREYFTLVCVIIFLLLHNLLL